MFKRDIILSFDYELFFGYKSGTVMNSIIIPTKKILKVLNEKGMKGNFFVDFLMFKFLEKNNDSQSKQDLYNLKQQIKDIVRYGHRIELHLHPHWVDAVYNNDGTWNFDNFSHYMLSKFEIKDITSLFKEGCEYLNKLAREINPNYQIYAFRAGGWAIQPFKKIKEGFINANIKIDSSTCYGCYNLSDECYYDFRNIPQKSYYWFSENVNNEITNGMFLEIPISSYRRNIFYIVIDKIFKMLHLLRRETDGTHSRTRIDITNNETFFLKLFKLRKSNNYMLTFSGISIITLLTTFLTSRKREIYCFIDHPKDYTKSTLINLKIISYFSQTTTYKDFYVRFHNKQHKH